MALEAADLWWGYDRSLKAAEKRGINLASVLAEYIRGSFAVADTSLRQLAIHGTRVGGRGGGGRGVGSNPGRGEGRDAGGSQRIDQRDGREGDHPSRDVARHRGRVT